VKAGVVVLEGVATSEPAAHNVDEIDVGANQGREGLHVVRVPRVVPRIAELPYRGLVSGVDHSSLRPAQREMLKRLFAAPTVTLDIEQQGFVLI
jgi:hypothetical protein